jgi:hypothetical protein
VDFQFISTLRWFKTHVPEQAATVPAAGSFFRPRSYAQYRALNSAVTNKIISAMDYDKSNIAATYNEARELTPARPRRWRDLLAAHVDRSTISLVVGRFCTAGSTEIGPMPPMSER